MVLRRAAGGGGRSGGEQSDGGNCDRSELPADNDLYAAAAGFGLWACGRLLSSGLPGDRVSASELPADRTVRRGERRAVHHWSDRFVDPAMPAD
jgi:hypothetical protein